MPRSDNNLESHALHTSYIGLERFNFTYDDFFAEIVKSYSTVLVANNNDKLHLVCNYVVD